MGAWRDRVEDGGWVWGGVWRGAKVRPGWGDVAWWVGQKIKFTPNGGMWWGGVGWEENGRVGRAGDGWSMGRDRGGYMVGRRWRVDWARRLDGKFGEWNGVSRSSN